MKAEDLMLGDLLTFDECVNDKDRPIMRVDGILPDTLFVQINDSEGDDEVGYDDIVGIPLTPEILEKNGFKKTESDTLSQTWAWAEKSEKIYGRWVQITFYNKPINGVSYLTKIETCSSKGDGVNHLHSCDIESAHELQHALRLCGINLNLCI